MAALPQISLPLSISGRPCARDTGAVRETNISAMKSVNVRSNMPFSRYDRIRLASDVPPLRARRLQGDLEGERTGDDPNRGAVSRSITRRREYLIDGERVGDVTNHPAFKRSSPRSPRRSCTSGRSESRIIVLYAGRVHACANLPQMMHIARELCGGQICVTPNAAALREWRFPLMAREVLYLEKFYPLSRQLAGRRSP